ncbi:hypothetical protein IAT40_002554 [Kwoniella sp. CBS 6097]
MAATIKCLSKKILGTGRSTLPTYELGPLDRLAVNWFPIITVFLYAHSINSTTLQTAIEVLLDYYPHLAGRLHNDTKDGAARITHPGAGVDLYLAESEGGEPITYYIHEGNSSLDLFPDGGRSLIPSDPSSASGTSADNEDQPLPLLSFQLTHFPRGGSALGVLLSHVVADAHGFTQLLKDLSFLYNELSQGVDNPSLPVPPHITAYQPSVPTLTSSFRSNLYSLDPPSHGPFSIDVVGKVIRFDKTILSSLKVAATPQAATNGDRDAWISTFNALSAHLYQTIHRARVSSDEPLSPPDYFTSINLRKHLQHVLTGGDPSRYFPNCTINPFLTIPSEKLLNAPLSEVAMALHALSRSFNPGEAERTIDWLAANPGVHHGFRFGNGCFMVTQWTGFDLYAIEMGKRPLRISLPFTERSLVDGLAYFMPTEEKGAIDVYLTLASKAWDALVGGELLTRAVSLPTSVDQ